MVILGDNLTGWMGLKATKQRAADEASRHDSDIGRQRKKRKRALRYSCLVCIRETVIERLADWISGAGESGKSTIIKQMGIVYSSALSEDEPKTRINESTFELGSTKVQILDVDNQEPKRKKWLNCFEGVGYMIFVAALPSYDQHTAEGHNAVRLS